MTPDALVVRWRRQPSDGTACQYTQPRYSGAPRYGEAGATADTSAPVSLSWIGAEPQNPPASGGIALHQVQQRQQRRAPVGIVGR